MEDYTENRFGYLKELSTEELEMQANELMEDIENWQYDFETINNSYQKTEAHHEINNAKEKLNYIKFLLNERQSKRTR